MTERDIRVRFVLSLSRQLARVQPNDTPWKGYFDLVNLGDEFGLAKRQTSDYKYIFEDDFRLDWRTSLERPQSSSAFCDGSTWSHTDLSPQIVVESGELRIRLQVPREDKTVVTF